MDNTTEEEDVGLEKISRAAVSTASILRRKSTLPPKPPAAIYNLSFLWTALGENIAEHLKQNISDQYVFTNWHAFSPNAADYENLASANALFFKAELPNYENTATVNDSADHFAVILGQKIISDVITTKLDASNDSPIAADDTENPPEEAQDTTPTALDLLLCTTTADRAIEHMHLLQQELLYPPTGSTENSTKQPAAQRIQNAFSLEELNLGQERFVCIQLFFTTVEDADEEQPETDPASLPLTHDISFWLPVSLIEVLQDAVKMQNLIVNCNTDDPWFKNMLKSMLATPLKVDARLSEMHLTIAECSKLAVDQILPVGDGRLDTVSLMTCVNQGEYEISSGALCIWGERKAIQLSEDPSADFIMDISNLVNTSRANST